MTATMSVLGLILSCYPFLRSAIVRFPFGIGKIMVIMVQIREEGEVGFRRFWSEGVLKTWRKRVT